MTGPEFIVMLTRADSTVPDAMDRLQDVLANGVRHVRLQGRGPATA